MISKRAYELFRIQVSPKAIAETSSAVPSTVPATVASPALIPCAAPVAMTSVTIGPGVMTRTKVITRKAANSSGFMGGAPRCQRGVSQVSTSLTCSSVLAIAKQISAPQSCDPVRNPNHQAAEKKHIGGTGRYDCPHHARLLVEMLEVSLRTGAEIAYVGPMTKLL